MAVAPSTASDHPVDRPAAGSIAAAGPVRTCIGCRRKAAATELFRVVVAPGAILVPDPRRRLPGRGAWLHTDPGCVEAAVRRRAFARALRVPGPLDPAAVCEYVAQAGPVDHSDAGSPSATPQETKS